MKEFHIIDENGRELVYYAKEFYSEQDATMYGTPLHTPDLGLGNSPAATAIQNALTGLGIRTFDDYVSNQHTIQSAVFRAIKPFIVSGLKEANQNG